jgi:hypothetical protein
MKEGQIADAVVTSVTYPGNIAKAVSITQNEKEFFVGKFFEGSPEEHIKFGRKAGHGVVVKTAEELFDALFGYTKELDGFFQKEEKETV